MNCPFCGSGQVIVVNSRPNCHKTQIWRRRKCLVCSNTYTSYEKIRLNYITVVKSSGKKQKYSRPKMYASIYHSCLDKKGVDRGEVSRFCEKTADEVEKSILKFKKRQIASQEILNIVLGILRKKAPDTCLRYLAYRKGNDRGELMRILRKHFR